MQMIDRDPADLVRAFEAEAGLLLALGTALEHQRGAVASGDSGAFDSWTDGIRGLCDEFRVAGTHRLALVTAWTGSPTPAVAELDAQLEDGARPRVRKARKKLADAARGAARELDINRRVLSRAIEFRDGLVRTLLGRPSDAAPVNYGGAEMSGALLFDRTV